MATLDAYTKDKPDDEVGGWDFSWLNKAWTHVGGSDNEATLSNHDLMVFFTNIRDNIKLGDQYAKNDADYAKGELPKDLSGNLLQYDLILKYALDDAGISIDEALQMCAITGVTPDSVTNFIKNGAPWGASLGQHDGEMITSALERIKNNISNFYVLPDNKLSQLPYSSDNKDELTRLALWYAFNDLYVFNPDATVADVENKLSGDLNKAQLKKFADMYASGEISVDDIRSFMVANMKENNTNRLATYDDVARQMDLIIGALQDIEAKSQQSSLQQAASALADAGVTVADTANGHSACTYGYQPQQVKAASASLA